MISDPLNAHRYIEGVLAEAIVPFGSFIGDNFVFMHDIARPDTEKIVTKYLVQVGINTLEYPASSTDLNKIEQLRNRLRRRVRS